MKIEKKCYTNCINKSKCCSSKHWAFNIQFGGGKPQWTFLQHNGPMFNPPYVPHKVPVIINGHEVVLDELAEEYATMYARYIESEYASNNTFRKNFWKDFKLTIKNLNAKGFTKKSFVLKPSSSNFLIKSIPYKNICVEALVNLFFKFSKAFSLPFSSPF